MMTIKIKDGEYMIKFGTGGWRAIIGKDFIYDNIRLIAQALCDLAKEQGKANKSIIIGYDRRFLSAETTKWLSEVICANDIGVIMMNRSAPTPLIMHSVKTMGLYYGIEVTASHNPSSYNGIKLIVEEGRDAPLDVTERLESILEKLTPKDIKSVDYSSALSSGKVKILKNPFNDFIDDIISKLDMESIRNRGLRILFNPMHGSGTYPLTVILYTARCTIDLHNINRDAFFGGNVPAPTRESLKDFSDMVVHGNYDLGIAVDGDGDRLGIIDSDGKYIDANEVLVLLYYYLHEIKGWRGSVVRNLATTHMLDKIAEDLGEKCYEVPIGFKYVSSKIDETDAVLGGESSGGLTVRGHIFGKDSIYAASLFVEMISVLQKTPSEILKELQAKYGQYYLVEANIEFLPEQKKNIEKVIMEEKRIPIFDDGVKVVKVSYEDGCKIYFDDNSFIICRFSGTEPLLRIFSEAANTETASKRIENFRNFIL